MAAIDSISIVVLLTFVIMSSYGIYILRYKKVPPNTAMVVFGKRQMGTTKGYRVITGGAKFIVPVLESYALLPLNIRNLDLDLKKVVVGVDHTRTKVNIKCTAQVKISGDPRLLETAAEHLLNKTESDINEIAGKTIEGHIRGISRTMSFSDLEYNRGDFVGKVHGMAQNDLNRMGFEIRSLIIEDVQEIDYAKIGQISTENLEKQVKTILEKLLKEKGINPV